MTLYHNYVSEIVATWKFWHNLPLCTICSYWRHFEADRWLLLLWKQNLEAGLMRKMTWSVYYRILSFECLCFHSFSCPLFFWGGSQLHTKTGPRKVKDIITPPGPLANSWTLSHGGASRTGITSLYQDVLDSHSRTTIAGTSPFEEKLLTFRASRISHCILCPEVSQRELFRNAGEWEHCHRHSRVWQTGHAKIPAFLVILF